MKQMKEKIKEKKNKRMNTVEEGDQKSDAMESDKN